MRIANEGDIREAGWMPGLGRPPEESMVLIDLGRAYGSSWGPYAWACTACREWEGTRMSAVAKQG